MTQSRKLTLHGRHLGAPVLQSIPGGPTGTCQATFKAAQVARYIKPMLTSTKATWWSIRELSVNK